MNSHHNFNEDHDLFRQSVRQFIESEVVPNAAAWESNEKIPRAVFQRMGELGFLGINFPEIYGGSNADFFYTVVYLEELARATISGFVTAVSVHQYMATHHILSAGSDELKKKYLPPSIAGDMVGSLGISEPGAGSDVSKIRTTAVLKGDQYIINGSKTFITNGKYGNFVSLACKTDADKGVNGISLIVVDKNADGVSSSQLKKLGLHCSDTAEIFFDNVSVPASNLIGKENQGFYYIMESFQLERLVASVASISAAQHAIQLAIQYINEREAFGQRISKFQVLRHSLADIITEVEVARQFVYHTCNMYQQKKNVIKECSMAKLKSSELCKQVADVCLQCFGGYGYMEDYPIARMYRDARAGTIAGGTSEILREIIAKMTIDGTNYSSAYDGVK